MSESPGSRTKPSNSRYIAVAKGPKPSRKRRPRKSIRLDRVNPQDFAKYEMIFCCEQCSHFDSVNTLCTIGFKAQHTRERQLELYNLTGAMAFCRFLEID